MCRRLSRKNQRCRGAAFSGVWQASAIDSQQVVSPLQKERGGANRMCLAIPAQIVELRDGDNALVDLAGVKKEISLALVEGVAIGDYVIVHVGYALNKLDPEEAAKTLKLFAEMGELAFADENPTIH